MLPRFRALLAPLLNAGLYARETVSKLDKLQQFSPVYVKLNINYEKNTTLRARTGIRIWSFNVNVSLRTGRERLLLGGIPRYV